MKRSMRLLMLVAIAAITLLAAANVGVAKPLSPTARQAPNCTFTTMPTFPCAVAGTTASSPEELARICNANPMACGAGSGGGGTELKPCDPGQMPTRDKPCIPSMNGGNGGNGGNGSAGGGTSNIDWGNLPACAAGTMPTPQAPCKFDMPDCAAGQMPSTSSPCKPQPCAPGAKPTKNAPCMPAGQDGGFDTPPPPMTSRSSSTTSSS